MSEVKNVPELRFPEFDNEWNLASLNELAAAKFSNGVFNDPKKVGSGFRLINVKDMFVGDFIDVENLTLIELEQREFEKNRVSYGDVFFTRSSLVAEGIAVSNICLNNEKDITYDGHLVRMRPDLSKLNPMFLGLALKTSYLRSQLIVRGKTTTMTTIGQEDIKTVNLPYPSIEEQKKIADFLSSVDKKIEQLTEKHRLLTEYKKGVMQQIFTQQIRFKDDEGNDYPEWEFLKLKKVATFFSGGTPTSSKKSFYVGNIPFIKSGEINSIQTEQFISEEALKASSAKMVKKGDILYALYGATSGEVAISKVSGAINQAVLCIRSEQVKAYIFSWLKLNKELILSTYLQGGQGNLSAQIIKELELPFPTVGEQQKMANFLTEIDQKIDQLGSILDQTKAFKKGLLQKMFV